MEPEACIVIVTVDAPLELMPALAAHAQLGIDRFPEFPGFRSGTLHVSGDGTRLVQYLVWASEAQYEHSIQDPTWEDLPSTTHFMELMEGPDVHVDARAYLVRNRSEGAG